MIKDRRLKHHVYHQLYHVSITISCYIYRV